MFSLLKRICHGREQELFFGSFMNYERRKKQLRIRIEDAWVHVWLPALVLLLASIWLWKSAVYDHLLLLNLKVENPGVVQLFVDDGSGFSEENSIRKEVMESDNTQKLEFDLTPFESIVQLRVDPINNDGFVMIDRLDYRRPGQWRSLSLLQPEYPASNGIRWQWNARDAELGIYPNAGNSDPNFIISGEFLPISAKSILLKRFALHLGCVFLGALGGFLLGKWILNFLVGLWIVLMIPWTVFRKAILNYTIWIDRTSLKWGFVNPTSCFVAGVLVAVYSWFLVADSQLVSGREARLTPVLKFEITNGIPSERVYGFIALEKGEISKYPMFTSEETSQVDATQTVSVFLKYGDLNIVGIRIDPMEKEGQIDLANLRIEYADGAIAPLSFESWVEKGDATIVVQGENFVSIRSSGIDPYITSPNLHSLHKTSSTLPVEIGSPLIVWFLVTFGLLLYNRLRTEDLTTEQIRDLQRM